MIQSSSLFQITLRLATLIVFLVQSHHVLVSSFVIGRTIRNSPSTFASLVRHTTPIRASTSDDTDTSVDRLLELVDVEEVDTEANGEETQSIVVSLSRQQDDSTITEPTNFTALLGNYNVTHVIPSKPNEKPVGGKWSRGPAQALFKTRRTLQHLLTPKLPGAVAEAVNVITLSALRDSFRIHVILRGDAYQLTGDERADVVQERQTPGGLSSKSVRANFDAPRIVLARSSSHNSSSLLNLSIGPPSSVILDTPYCDGRIRIGKGSRGSWFVFKRCSPNDVEADEWKKWIAQSPVKKSKALAVLAGSFGIGLVGYNAKGVWRIGGVALSTVSLLAGAVISFSTGGIARDRDSVGNETRTSTN